MVQINKIHTKNTQRKIKGLVSMKRSDTSPFLKQPHLFYQPLHFYGRNLKPAPFFSEISKTQSPPLYNGVGGPTMLQLFQLKKLTFTILFVETRGIAYACKIIIFSLLVLLSLYISCKKFFIEEFFIENYVKEI